MFAGISNTKEIVLVFVIYCVICSSTNENIQLEVNVEKSEGRLLVTQNCSASKEPSIPVAAFLLNNKSLANIGPTNESCFIGRQKCQYSECECGSNYFVYKKTLNVIEKDYIFVCELRFDNKISGNNIHVAVQASVLYNSSGLYPLKETKEKKGPPSSKKEPNRTTEQDNGGTSISGIVPITFVVAVLATVCLIYKRTKCQKKQKKSPNSHKSLVPSRTAELEPSITLDLKSSTAKFDVHSAAAKETLDSLPGKEEAMQLLERSKTNQINEENSTELVPS
ncbi:uncharacterized protein LOC127709412 isoform X2 [Mytilus californianus]|uniref:uncharacterized protein LOC127709412 isoform X2 n=1 Tax=Mytilus californianus TaxID=6549 RepID=UPI0022474A50|nr:uncharacterized protein LOC127709412 isoform X2 [Mytilus californianus]XP_052070908.1 uncharacterized protein LOC127709412 isoform X2 [Mytilus californianus]